MAYADIGIVLRMTKRLQESFEFPACKRRIVAANFSGAPGHLYRLKENDMLVAVGPNREMPALGRIQSNDVCVGQDPGYVRKLHIWKL